MSAITRFSKTAKSVGILAGFLVSTPSSYGKNSHTLSQTSVSNRSKSQTQTHSHRSSSQSHSTSSHSHSRLVHSPQNSSHSQKSSQSQHSQHSAHSSNKHTHDPTERLTRAPSNISSTSISNSSPNSNSISNSNSIPNSNSTSSQETGSLSSGVQQSDQLSSQPEAHQIEYSPDQISARAISKVFPLVNQPTGSSSNESKVSEEKDTNDLTGTAFVVNPRGILITNYQTIATTLENPGQYRLELKVGPEAIPAKILSVDIPNDLAIIEVEHSFNGSYKISPRTPVTGEKVYSPGFNHDLQLSAIEIEYRELVKTGMVSRLTLFLPLNTPVNSGPIVNRFDELVGINSLATQSEQEIVTAIPHGQLVELVKKTALSKKSTLTNQSHSDIQSQIRSAQMAWLGEWKAASPTLPSPVFGRYQIYSLPPHLKCKDTSRTHKSPVKLESSLECYSQSFFSIAKNVFGGRISIQYISIFDHTMDSKENSEQIKTIKETEAQKFDKEDRSTTQKTPFICHHRYVKNKQDLSFLSEYCIQSISKSPGVYNYILTASPISSDAGAVATLSLQGFTTEGIQLATELFLDKIEDRVTR